MSVLLSIFFQCVSLQQLNSPFIFRIVVVACLIDFIFSLCSTIVATAGHLFILVPSNSTTAKLRESWNPSQLVSSTGATGLLYKLVLL